MYRIKLKEIPRFSRQIVEFLAVKGMCIVYVQDKVRKIPCCFSRNCRISGCEDICMYRIKL